jgi:hypothetical protein
MYGVQISGRIIRWPSVCACCARPADTTVEVRSTRTTAKRVIDTQTKSCDVPYCNRCLSHIQAAKELGAFSRIVINGSWLIGIAGTVATLLTLGFIPWESVFLAPVLSLLMVAGTVGLLVLTWQRCQEKHRLDLEAREAERARLKRHLESLLSKTCSEKTRLAAQYHGWNGSVHTFYFSSAGFAAALERANPGKCQRGGQVRH